MAQVVSWSNSSFTWFSDGLVDAGGNTIGIHWVAFGT